MTGLLEGAHDTIFALSSGSPPAAIAVVRVSGAAARDVVATLAGRLPPPRRASLRILRDPSDSGLIDRALLLWLPGPATATGEDLAEFHLHGGRAVIGKLLDVLAAQSGLRAAEPGEFTRRAFYNGRIDLLEAEGLADLLTAETEQQRRSAIAVAEGGLSQKVESWRIAILHLAATVEALLDFGDEDEVAASEVDLTGIAANLAEEMRRMLEQPPAERLRDGVRVVLGGPPNVGKSSLLNILAGREVAIVSPEPGTTRDIVEAPVSICGMPFLLSDTAGLRAGGGNIERIGMSRAGARIAEADILLWMGDDSPPSSPAATLWLRPRIDLPDRTLQADRLGVSVVTGEGIDKLVQMLVSTARTLLPREDEVVLSRRQKSEIEIIHTELQAVSAAGHQDSVLQAEHLRRCRDAVDRLTGRAGFEDMMDVIFGQFCLGK